MLTCYKPEYRDLWFRQFMLSDPETMSYNHAWGGTISFPEERWQEWYDFWICEPEGKRFYRYLKDETGIFVGEIAYHFDSGLNGFIADVIVLASQRGKGYGDEALELLCNEAAKNGISESCRDGQPRSEAVQVHQHRRRHRVPQQTAGLVDRDSL